MSSEKTAAAAGKVGMVRRDPMAMLPFCGYNMADYWGHWLEMGEKAGAKMPKIYYVNWFRKGADGRFLWPGYGENSRVIKWIFERLAGRASARETAIGYLPEDIDLSGLGISEKQFSELFNVDSSEWLNEIDDIKKHYARFGAKLPAALTSELQSLEQKLK